MEETKSGGPSSWESQGEESNQTVSTEVPVTDEEAVTEEQTPALIEEEVNLKYNWTLCSFEGAQDYIPCLDNKKWLDTHRHHKHYEHRERHCPPDEELPKCLIPMPPAYKPHIKWSDSRDQVSSNPFSTKNSLRGLCFDMDHCDHLQIWYSNVPHTGLVSYKADQQWVKKSGDKLVFPGGGTQFMQGARHYIDWVEKVQTFSRFVSHVRHKTWF